MILPLQLRQWQAPTVWMNDEPQVGSSASLLVRTARLLCVLAGAVVGHPVNPSVSDDGRQQDERNASTETDRGSA
jgi:hypothetical protein